MWAKKAIQLIASLVMDRKKWRRLVAEVNYVGFEIFYKQSALQMLYEKENSFSTFVKPVTKHKHKCIGLRDNSAGNRFF